MLFSCCTNFLPCDRMQGAQPLPPPPPPQDPPGHSITYLDNKGKERRGAVHGNFASASYSLPSPHNADIKCKKCLTNPLIRAKISKSSAASPRLEPNMGVFPSGQWGQTVNLLLFSFGGSNPPAPTKQEKSEPISDWRRVRIFCFLRIRE